MTHLPAPRLSSSVAKRGQAAMVEGCARQQGELTDARWASQAPTTIVPEQQRGVCICVYMCMYVNMCMWVHMLLKVGIRHG